MNEVEPIRNKKSIRKVERVLKKQSSRDLLLFVMGTNTGLRVSDILALNVGDVKDKDCIIIDDMVDTAGTLTIVANFIKNQGARSVYACCTHALLSGNAMERINGSAIKELVCTNTVKLSEDKLASGKVVQLSVANLLGQGIMNIIDDRPVSYLFGYEKKK